MEVCEEIIAHPYMKYKVMVSHLTPRKSTAFEWLFLEALIKAEGSEFQNENLEDFFKKYFMIDNPEKLIMPVLKTLYDLSAVTCKDLTDDTTLNQLKLSDVKVLPLGKEMQQKGFLPAEEQRDIVNVVYDALNKKLITDRNNFTSEPKGNYIPLEEEGNEKYFPEKQIRNYLEAQKTETENQVKKEQTDSLADDPLVKAMLSKNRPQAEDNKKKNKKAKQKKIDWLKADTQISAVFPSERNVCYENSKHKVQLKDGLLWKLEGNKAVELEEASLKNFENNPPEGLKVCPVSSITKPDSQVQELLLFSSDTISNFEHSIKNVQYRINYATGNNNCKAFIVENSFFNEENFFQKISDGKNKNKDVKSVIVFNANKLAVKAESGRLIVTIPSAPEAVIHSACIYVNNLFCIKAEKFPVRAGDVSRDITFSYIPKKNELNVRDCILSIVEQYYKSQPAVLLLLNEENGLKKEFNGFLDKLVADHSASDKDKILNELNQLNLKLTGKKLLSNEVVADSLIDKNQIKQTVKDFPSAIKVIKEYTKNPAIKNQVLTELLKAVIPCLQPTDSLEDVWALIDLVKQKAPGFHGYLNKQGIWGKFYSEKAKNDYFEKVFTGKIKTAHWDFEERVFKLYELCIKISTETDKKKLNEFINSWRSNLHNLEKIYGSIKESEKYNQVFEAKMNANKKMNNGGKK